MTGSRRVCIGVSQVLQGFFGCHKLSLGFGFLGSERLSYIAFNGKLVQQSFQVFFV